jgi:hypothetical protein
MRKMTKAEAGALGSKKSKLTNNKLKQDRISQYTNNPNHCQECKKVIDYEHRYNKFCGYSCSAIFNNKKRTSKTNWTCHGCGRINHSSPYKNRKFCNIGCQTKIAKHETFTRLIEGKLSNRSTIKNAFIRNFGHKCSSCNLEEWKGVPIPLEVDHIDGNAGNNSYSNLRILCPN